MRIIRFAIFILGIFLIIFLLSLLLPSTVTISKSVDINAPQQSIKRQITDFGQWKNWYPAFRNESFSINKNQTPPGFLSSITLRDSLGKWLTILVRDTSKQTINVNLHSPSALDIDYEFVLIHKLSNQTQLTWNVIIHLGWLPWNKFEGIVLDKFSGEQYENALDNIKSAAEKS